MVNIGLFVNKKPFLLDVYCKYKDISYCTDVLPLPRRVTGKPATYSIFTINVGQEAANIEEAFDLVAEFRERHFIIACEMNCVREVFHQVCGVH